MAELKTYYVDFVEAKTNKLAYIPPKEYKDTSGLTQINHEFIPDIEDTMIHQKMRYKVKERIFKGRNLIIVAEKQRL